MTGDQIYSVIDSFKQEEGVTVQKVNEASFEIILPAARLSQIGQKLYKLPDQCIMQIDINSYERKKAPTSSR